MIKIVKKAIALILCMIIIIGILPLGVLALEKSEGNQNDLSVLSGQGLGTLLNSISASDDNELCYIESIDFDSNKAIVEYQAYTNCSIVVGVYDEDTYQLLGTGIKNVDRGSKSTEILIDISNMPQYFKVKAFMLDNKMAPIGKSYSTLEFTKAHEEFLKKTPEDFDGSSIVYFDEVNKKSNFAVLKDSVVTSDSINSMTWSYDKNTSTYIFSNAIDEIKQLKPGETYFCQFSNNESDILLFKVKSINVSGSTVTITEDEKIVLQDVFDFARIESTTSADSDFIDKENLPSCLEPIEDSEMETQGIDLGSINYDETTKISKSLSVKYPNNKSDNPQAWAAGISVSGKIDVSGSASAKVYYDVILFGKDYYEVSVDIAFTFEFSVSVSGKIEVDKNVVYIPIKVPFGVFSLDGKIYPVLSFSITLEAVKVTYTSKVTLYASSDTKEPIINQDSSNKWESDFGNVKAEVKIGIGIEVGITAVECLEVGISIEGGIKIVGDPSIVGIHNEICHDCNVCFDCTLYIFVEGTLFVKLKFFTDKLSVKWDALKISKDFKLDDAGFYISISDDGLSIGSGSCPRKSYAVKIKIVDKTKVVDGATVECSTGKSDSNNDGKYEETSSQTNEEGIVKFYCRPGSHTFKVSMTGYKEKSNTIRVTDEAKFVTINLDESGQSGPSSQDNPTGNVKWEYIASGNTLRIYGSGNMPDYSSYDAAPWYKDYSEKAKKVVVDSGVTSIGDYAFSQLRNLESVFVSDTVTKIGTAAFYECNSLQSVILPSSVKVIDDYAFYDCYSMTSIDYGNTERIGSFAFAECDGLTSVILPGTADKLGNSAFAHCDGLNSVTINNSNCDIYDSENTIPSGAVIYGATNSTAQQFADKYGRNFGTITTQSARGTGIIDYSYSACKPDCEYILLNVTSYGNGFRLTSSNLEFIDQITSDGSGKVEGKFIPRKVVSGCAVLLAGDFGNGPEVKEILFSEETSGSTDDSGNTENPDPIVPDIEIKNYRESLSVPYKSKLVFHTVDEAPAGYKTVWSNGQEGSICTISKATDKEYKISAKLVKISDNSAVNESKTEIITVSTGFFARLIAFFRDLLGRLPVYEDNIKR